MLQKANAIADLQRTLSILYLASMNVELFLIRMRFGIINAYILPAADICAFFTNLRTMSLAAHHRRLII